MAYKNLAATAFEPLLRSSMGFIGEPSRLSVGLGPRLLFSAPSEDGACLWSREPSCFTYGGFQKIRALFGGPYVQDHSAFASILRPLLFENSHMDLGQLIMGSPTLLSP